MRIYSSLPIVITGLILLIFGCQKGVQEDQAKTAQTPSKPQFELLPSSQTGVTCVNTLPEGRYQNILVYQYYYNGGGVGIGDLNGDAKPDLVFTQNLKADKIYLNQGNFSFKDVSVDAGFVTPAKNSWVTGVALADVNQDGKLDIYLNRAGMLKEENRRNLLYINEGNNPDGTPQFREAAEEFGLADPGYSVQTVFFDYDRDGDLDAYVLNHGAAFPYSKKINSQSVFVDKNFSGGDKLMENRKGKFVEVTRKAKIQSTAIGYGLGVSVEDFNQDGWPDLYVSNDFFEHDYFYLNKKDGTFEDVSHTALNHMSNFSMGNDAADINNDGLPDVMVLDMVAEDNRRLKANMSGMNPETFYKLVEQGYHHQYMFNSLQLNRGNGTFGEIGQLAGVSNTDWSWAPLLADFDNDGWKDLFVTNGLRKDVRNTDFQNRYQAMLAEVAKDPSRKDLSIEEWKKVLASIPSEKIANYAFHNQGGSGLRFQNKAKEWGLGRAGFSNGAAYGDLDGDGDLELVVSNIDEPPFIYKNNARENGQGNYLSIRFEGPEGNKQALGTEVRTSSGAGQQLYKNYAIRGFQSTVQQGIHIGLGKEKQVDELLVTWPDGKVQNLANVQANQSITLKYADANQPGSTGTEDIKSMFRELVGAVSHDHNENTFDDYQREVLLPHKMSQFGPSMAVADVNGDGRDDFFVGGAKNQKGVLYLSEGEDTFEASRNNFGRKSEDMGATFFDADGDGDLDLYVVSGGNEEKTASKYYHDRLYLNNGKGKFSEKKNALPKVSASGGKVVGADMDKDGDIDLLVTGRQLPGEYPLPGHTQLLQNDEGKFTDISEQLPELKEAGMLTSALWLDLDGDGYPELITAGEWTPIQIWPNLNGKLQPAQTLTNSEGWWYSLAHADMDGDGDQDLIAGNLGLNYKYKASPVEPFEVYSKDFDENGQRDIVLSYYQNGNLFPLRGRSCSSQQIPDLKKKFPGYDAFAEATLIDVYAQMGLSEALNYKAKTFASVWIENKGGDNWVLHALPDMAQLSAVHAIIPKDLNKDGKMDLILGGNLYVSEVETQRADAACGLVLMGGSEGDFSPVGTLESGLFAPGDVRDMKFLNQSILLVANNDGPIQAFSLNSTALLP